MADAEFIPFALPSIGDEEIAEIVATLRSGWLTTGPKVRRFEEEFAEFLGIRHALAVNSATSGLHLSLEAVGVGPGDRVLTTPYTFTATAEVVSYLGADPLFVDIDPETFNLDPIHLEAVARDFENIRAVIPVHFGGQACDMAPILDWAGKHDIVVVEDAAHALPTTYDGRLIGTVGDLTVFSFYATKTLTTGEGGMVVTDDSDYASRIRTMRLHGIDRQIHDRYVSDNPSWYYEVVAPGFKYNMTDMAASLGIHQLKKARGFRSRREAIALRYNEAFTDLPIRLPVVRSRTDMHAWHLFVILLDPDEAQVSRDEFIERMREEGIGTSVHFIPLHLQPYWRDRYGFVPDDFPVAHETYRRAVSLPIYPEMTDENVERVVASVHRALGAR